MGEPLPVVTCTLHRDLGLVDVVMAQNMAFLAGTLECEAVRIGAPTLVRHVRRVCHKSAAQNWMAIPGDRWFKYPSLDEIVFKLFGLQSTGRRSPEDDVHLIARACFALMNHGVIQHR